MSITKPIAIALLLTPLGLLPGACGHHEADGHNHGHEAAASGSEAEGHDDHDSHEGLILLNPADLATLGVEACEVQPADFANTLKVSGEIAGRPGADGNVAARQAGLVKFAPGIAEGAQVVAGRAIATVTARGMSGGDPNEGAAVAYAAARREVDRLTPLHKEGIVSTRDYNAALERMEAARAAMGSAKGNAGSTATAPIGGTLTRLEVVDGQYVESGSTIAVISSNSALSLRADIPVGQVDALGAIAGARVRASGADGFVDIAELGGAMAASPSVASASGGYVPVYFNLAGGHGLRNGAYCEVYLLGQPRHGVISLPEEAVSEQQGRYFVYLEHSPGHYEKRPVEIGASDGLRREIRAGVNPGDRIVCRGTTYVKLAETSGVVPEGHSHSH